MKILRLVYEWPPPWDGLAPGPYELTKAQQKLGHDITVFCGGGFKSLGQAEELNDIEGKANKERLYRRSETRSARVTAYSKNTRQASNYKRSHSGARRSDSPGRSASVYVAKGYVRRRAKHGDEAIESTFGTLKVFRFPRALRKLSLFLTTAPCVFIGYLWLKLTGRGPDLVHGHGHITACFNIYKALFGWLDKTPYVLHLHVTAVGRAARLFSGGVATFTSRSEQEKKRGLKPATLKKHGLDFWTKYWEWPLHKFSDWLGVRVADKVICVSSRVREEAIKHYGADPEKLVVVENGVNTELFNPGGVGFAAGEAPGASSLQPQGLGNAAKAILYVGALQPRKNVHLLIEALAKLPEKYHLVIVGQGDKDYEKKLRRMVDELDLEDRVKLKGYIEYPKLPSIYQKADVFVIPSQYEGLPKVVLEALASGVPVLASGFDVEESVEGLEFLENLDSEVIARKIEVLLKSNVAVAEQSVRERFSWEQKAEEIDDIYSVLL